MSKLKAEKPVSLGVRTRVVSTGIPGVSAKTIINKQGTEVSGYLIESDTFAPIGDIDKERKYRTISNPAEADFKRAELIAALTKHYKAKYSSAPLSLNVGMFSTTYMSMDDASREFLFSNWSNSTARGVRSFLEIRILPELDKLSVSGITISDADLIKIKADLLEHAEANKRSRKDEDTAISLDDRLYRINVVLQRLHMSNPSLPLIQFPLEQSRRRTYREQIKALPDEVRHKLFLLLIEMAKSGRQLVLAVALMLFAGLRTGEAAAATFEDINVISDRYATYYVNKRLDTTGKIETILKSENAYRVVVLPFAFVCLYNVLIASFAARRVEPPSGYIIGDEKFDLSQFSATIKQFLIDSGLTREAISEIVDLMFREPDVVDGERITDPTAYILRRDWATRAVNCCGLSYRDLDYYLGHANDQINRKDYLDELLQGRIARQLEQYIIHPDCSLHPGFCSININNADRISVDETNRCVIHKSSEQKQLVRLDLLTREPGDTVSIVFPRAPKKCRVSAVPENPMTRSYRPIQSNFSELKQKEIQNESTQSNQSARVE